MESEKRVPDFKQIADGHNSCEDSTDYYHTKNHWLEFWFDEYPRIPVGNVKRTECISGTKKWQPEEQSRQPFPFLHCTIPSVTTCEILGYSFHQQQHVTYNAISCLEVNSAAPVSTPTTSGSQLKRHVGTPAGPWEETSCCLQSITCTLNHPRYKLTSIMLWWASQICLEHFNFYDIYLGLNHNIGTRGR